MVTGNRQEIINQVGLTAWQQLLKRCFDIVGAFGLLLVTWPIILIAGGACIVQLFVSFLLLIRQNRLRDQLNQVKRRSIS